MDSAGPNNKSQYLVFSLSFGSGFRRILVLDDEKAEG